MAHNLRKAFALMALLPAFAQHAFAADGTNPAHSAALGREAVGVLTDYLKIDTTNPPGNEIRAAQFFKAIFDREGIEARIFESAPGRGNIVARLKGDGSKKAVVLMNHMDVVPADRRYWTVDPFGAMAKEGFVWGRGALDMKGLGVLQVMAMLSLKRQGIPLQADIIFLGTADEEAGGEMGAGFMVKQHFDLFKDAGVVLNEFGWILTGDDGKVRYYAAYPAEKVPFWLKLTATGTPGHGSSPRPDSAVLKLVEALHRIAAYKTPLKVEDIVQKFYAQTAHLDPVAERRKRLKDLRTALLDPVFAAEFTKDLRANAMVRNTISITMLEGSNKINVIPPEASAQLDVRLLPSEDPQQFLGELRTIIADDSIRIEPVLSFPPSTSPVDSEFFHVLREVANVYDPGAVVAAPMITGFTDCHYFREKGIPCYGFMPFKLTPRDLGGVHGNDERVSVDNVVFGTEVMTEIVRRMATK
jgi:acetylornithine deacetylase/succinyl-diaminopimelate desuccinylase-like protein